MDLGLSNKTALVVGGSAGIGLSIANGLLMEGCSVIIVGRDVSRLSAAAKALREKFSKNLVHSINGDISKDSFVTTLDGYIKKNNICIDILICNAGGPPPVSFSEATTDDWQEATNTLFHGPINLVSRLVPEMCERGWGRVISIGSTVMQEPSSQMVISASVRAGFATFLKAVSREVASSGVTCNSISTGGVETERLSNLFRVIAEKENSNVEMKLKSAAESIPIKRFSTAEEFSWNIVYLCSERSSYLTGQVIGIDGGLLNATF